jgi:hypothetical protein
MQGPARVNSIDALREAKAALRKFAEEVDTALAEVESDAQRTLHWLAQEQTTHWQRQLKVRADRVAEARSILTRKQLSSSQDKPSCVEERKALERAKRALEEAETKAKATKRWLTLLEREVQIYRAQAATMQDAVAREIPAAERRLDAMAEILDQYATSRPSIGRAPQTAEPGEREQQP